MFIWVIKQHIRIKYLIGNTYYSDHHFYTYNIHKCFITGRQRQSDWFWMKRENNHFLLSFLHCNGKSNKTLSLQKNYRIGKRRTEQANFFVHFVLLHVVVVVWLSGDSRIWIFLLKCNKLSSDIFCGYGRVVTSRCDISTIWCHWCNNKQAIYCTTIIVAWYAKKPQALLDAKLPDFSFLFISKLYILLLI